MERNIKGKIMSGFAWVYSARIAAQIVTLLISIVLARLLNPSDYSEVAIIGIFIAFADVFIESGLATALIQNKSTSENDYSTVFVASFTISVILYMVVFFAAPAISAFYKIPHLVVSTRVMCLQIVMYSLYTVQQAYINKKLEFKKIFASTVIGTVSSAIIGVILAFCGYGVWALIAQSMTSVLISMLILLFSAKWKPRLFFSWERFLTLFGYGWKILLSGFLIKLNTEINDIVIGKRFTPLSLSYLSKGKEYPRAISTNINGTISSVVFPTMSLYQDNRIFLKDLSRKAIRTGTYVLTPLLFGFAAAATPFVTLVLTEKWLPCVPYLRVMCFLFALQPVQTSSVQAMKAVGRSDTYLKLQIVKTIISIGAVFVSVTFFDSPIALAWGMLSVEIVGTVLNFPTNKKEFKYKYFEQVSDSFAMMIPSIVMYLTVSQLDRLELASLPLIALQIIVGIVEYVLVSELFRIDVYKNMKRKALNKFRGRKSTL